ncbi:hypothetical protein COY23_00380 [bacterium (Candidatus Torokbacteria) CG_4_10_14_0_2_um_filter_35_8]|nr:MAG: hypothetical protein COY23_00380 [bacterium (Candidatus Torokbacteria) CG_4_10_14_0_2_um_filter_35_8]
MSCVEFIEILDDLLSGQAESKLDSKEREEIFKHRIICPDCEWLFRILQQQRNKRGEANK